MKLNASKWLVVVYSTGFSLFLDTLLTPIYLSPLAVKVAATSSPSPFPEKSTQRRETAGRNHDHRHRHQRNRGPDDSLDHMRHPSRAEGDSDGGGNRGFGDRKHEDQLKSRLESKSRYSHHWNRKLISSPSSPSLFSSPASSTFGSKRTPSPFSSSSNTTYKRPNIVFILTDDQDIELGSMNFMPKTLRILGEGGTHFSNAYTTTPMCCPSRSSILTGLYTHNHNVHTNNDNCSSPQWQADHEPKTFAAYLSNAGYRTAFFGKYLNEYNGSYIPPGWREWSALIRNSRFYNYTINVNGRKVKHADNYYLDYYPDLIANDSLLFMRQSKQFFPNKPVMMVMSFPSPHGPEDAAPQYQHLFYNVTTHRTPSWDYAPNLDKQWLLRYTGKMGPIHKDFTDLLHTKRLQTLQSVDSAVERVYNELLSLGELDNTYIVYTSDHGYHLGQFGLVKGKSMPFEFDVRVPFYVRGPRVPAGVRIQDIVLNVDIAPTILEMGGVSVPDHIDGKSIVPLLNDANDWIKSNKQNDGEVRRKKSWRDSFLIERGKFMKEIIDENGLPAFGSKMSKKQRLAIECQKLEYQPPCEQYQKFECILENGEYRIRKCRKNLSHDTTRRPDDDCDCSEEDINEKLRFLEKDQDYREVKQSPEFLANEEHIKYLDSLEKRLQRRFLKDHVSNRFKPKFIGKRHKRGVAEDIALDNFDINGVFELSRLLDAAVTKVGPNETNLDFDRPSKPRISRQQGQDKSGCLIHGNHSVSCPVEVYENKFLWREKKGRIDQLIKKLQMKLEELKGIRRHLKRKRPSVGPDTDLDDRFEPPLRGPDNCKCNPKRHQRHHYLRTHYPGRKHWRLKEEKWRKKERKMRRKSKFENTTCNLEKMNCFTHDNDHWKTAPFWTEGPFCFCQNSNNNSFTCLRTFNEKENFLYCEFVTGFITFYDMRIDPYQLRNVVYDLDFSTLEELKRQLNKLRNCVGAKECTIRYKPPTATHEQHQLNYDVFNPRQPSKGSNRAGNVWRKNS